MFSKPLSLLALLPLVASLTVQIPEDPHSQGQITIHWTVDSRDDPPLITIELINESFNNAFAIANNVDTSLGVINVTLPVVPDGSGYSIQFVDIGNINNVYAETAEFSIGAVVSASLTSTSDTASSSGTGTSSGQSTSASSTGTTRSPSNTRSTTSTASNTGSQPLPTPTNFNNDNPDGASTLGINIVGAGLAAVAAAFLAL